ncbi:MAG TPA: hypothetical protein VFG73_02520 [Rhodanobacteraceae bacterium]|nr:hypothetical protein [Rhodanobacteraceae bacterium]
MSAEAAELRRAYQRGYNAGKRRLDKEMRAEREQAQARALWDNAVLASTPYFLACQGWTIGEKRVSTTDDRANLACSYANAVLKYARRWAP